jgi:hypothetical protein
MLTDKDEYYSFTALKPRYPTTLILAGFEMDYQVHHVRPSAHRETAGRGGGIHTVPYPSWQHLSAALNAVGIEESELPDLKAKLDREGRGHIPEVLLDEADVRNLGFTRKQIPANAFA